MKQTKARQQRLEKLVAERSAYWATKRPGWVKTPIAVIESPLKVIRNLCREQNEDGTTSMSPVYYMAADFARNGDGQSVTLIAKTLLNA